MKKKIISFLIFLSLLLKGVTQHFNFRNFNLEDPQDNQIQIKTSFSGINFADIMTRMGLYPGAPKPPHSIGAEASGVVEKVGNAVQNFKVGDSVMTFSFFDGYSSHINVSEDLAFKLPDGFTLSEGAAFPLVYMTAYMMMFDLGNLKKDEIFFIQGAGGGVGTFALQILKKDGVQIDGIDTGEKLKDMQKLGFDNAFDYKKSNLRKISEKYDFGMYK